MFVPGAETTRTIMRERIARLYRSISSGDSPFATALWRMRHGHPFNTIRKRVRGSENLIAYGGSLLHNVTVDIRGRGNRVLIAPRCILNSVAIRVRGDGHTLIIGPGCVFSEGGDLWLEDGSGTLEIGAGSTFVDAQLAVTEPGTCIRIGRDCLFAYDIEVRTGDSHAIVDASTGRRLNPAADVTIGDHVWVGVGCRVLKGSRLANDSVVGAGSVVTHAFDEPGVVIAGVPARVTRTGIGWQRERGAAPAVPEG